MTVRPPRPFTSRVLAMLLLAFAALMGVHGSASALTTQNGAMCKPWGLSQTPGLASYISGAFNNASGNLAVVCPVTRTIEAPATGFSVWVDGSSAAGTVSCTMFSWSYKQALLGSVTFSVSGIFDYLATLPASQVPMYSSQLIFCTLPPNAILYDIEPVQ